ncbi:similar to Saccharomyces cerevisiae YNL101W AVT4 Vacuolar transporter, exports large neutral amino acids from the vacuole [Maudiozyma barnettii]|uniref:Similar to Saccharomyces cerevisiae YNL101W AVT4 Vacuolar transporter, exports large neutral amino acids from the vacuole n=1 Tax=Maudiozyma barnettii TaxID=61262 RepID=A0A8H2VC49_9SACH|nr:Avt4p [Kazachstania barnettii]CAB4252507.1 similar to Saccharomyces cerevisiae YNL101W AVT4 Vacuolar transporter, exports large neutral amino acids from the vacuole [Kazachstania barnettii]CAD1779241.1 similar to Saccharomyces cerevisiae YNL101W AVT4 Vacuolar transporter, exports large neutral amino acids from the vacuole [Kazachstania barnettii]
MFSNSKYELLDSGSNYANNSKNKNINNNLSVPRPTSSTTIVPSENITINTDDNNNNNNNNGITSNKVKNIEIPSSNSNRGGVHPLLINRRNSTIKNTPIVANLGKSVDSHVFVSIHSPNFRTSQDGHQEEIMNSVRENYLNNTQRKNSMGLNSNTGSLKSDSITLRTQSPARVVTDDENPPLGETASELDDPSLKSTGGDILRDIYKMTNHPSDSNLKRQKSTDDVRLTMESRRRQSAAGGLNVPGGFRREFIVKKVRTKSTNVQSNISSIRNDYGTSRPGTPRPSTTGTSAVVLSSSSSVAVSDAHPTVDRESNQPIEQPSEVPFLTKNFMEFLYLYGHFAGESFEDDFFDDSGSNPLDGYENNNRKEESSPLIPLGSTEAVTKSQVSSMKGTASPSKVFLLLMKSFVGTGVLFLPQGFHNGGLTLSIFLLIFFGGYSYWCYYILIQSKVYTKVASFGDIGLKTYGPWMKFGILLALVLTQVGFSAAYMIFTAKNIGAFLQNVFRVENLKLGYIMLFQLIVFIPLSFIRNISKLSLPSLFANFFIMIGLIIILFFTMKHLFITLDMKPAEGVIYGVNGSRWTLFVGTAIFTFEGIGLIIPVQNSMKNPEKFPLVLGLVIITVTLLFVTVAVVGYLSYGSKVETVILLNLPQDNITVNLIQLFYSIAIMLSTPLQLFPAIKIIENKVFATGGKFILRTTMGERAVRQFTESGKSNWKVKWTKNLGRTFIVSTVVLTAYCGVDSLDKFVSIIGSFCCLPLVYVFPALLHLRCCSSARENGDDSKKTRFLIIVDQVLVLFGIISMVYTSYQSIFT